MFWLLIIVAAVALAYIFRVQLLSRILGQPESRIERQLKRKRD